MKKMMILILICLLMAGCNTEPTPAETTVPTTDAAMQLGNPWKSYDSLTEAESASGLVFPLPETVANSYMAESWRVMNEQLLEVVYRDKNDPQFEVTVRMQAGEEQDLSGVYGDFENVQTVEVDEATVTVKSIDGGVLQLISKDGYSYSLYAPNHYWGDSNIEFLQYIYDVY